MRITTKDFSLATTLESGQVFRHWEICHERKTWHLVNERASFFLARQEDRVLHVKGADAARVRSYFRLDEDIPSFTDPPIVSAMRKRQGIRIIRQDPWQCLVSFIISQNSNIPRIRQNIEAISAAFGRKMTAFNIPVRAFPEPGSMASLEKLSACGLGYRAAYLHKLNRAIRHIDLDSVQQLPYADAKSILLTLQGVGEKVADCTLLFSLGFTEAFPVDVHIRRAVERCYFGGRMRPEKDIRAFAQKRFGKDAGYAQQYLFHAERTGRLKNAAKR